MKPHAEVVREIVMPVAPVALAEVARFRVAVMMQDAIEQRIAKRGIDGIVFGLMAHDHLQQRRYSLIEFALVIDAGVSDIGNRERIQICCQLPRRGNARQKGR